MTTSRPFVARLRFLALYTAAWLPVASVYAVLIFLQTPGRSVEEALSGAFFGVGSAALLGLGAWWWTSRLMEKTVTGPRLALAHLGAAMVYAGLWTGYTVYSISRYATPQAFDYFMDRAAGWHFLSGLLIYGIVAGIGHGILTSRRYAAQREAAVRADALRVRAELTALRSQLDPHFLFNTLHSIGALIRSDPKTAELAVERLGRLLRRVLDLSARENDRVALAEEWDLVRDQVELERLRLGARLQTDVRIDSDALDCLIPLLSLQPLVENAIRHGIAPHARGGCITIEAHVAGDDLLVTVRDNGVGADPSALTAGRGLGLRSIEQRIRRLYGARATLELTGATGQGVSARLVLPAEPLLYIAVERGTPALVSDEVECAR